LRDYNQITYGAFIQNTVANDWLDIETGLRGCIMASSLPRVSALFKISP
jgi:iron complex outermembrane receptor protein